MRVELAKGKIDSKGQLQPDRCSHPNLLNYGETGAVLALLQLPIHRSKKNLSSKQER